ncbi:hypothetical protein DYB28_001096 [Aphanomyces astaci]|uniref:Uncharacterized protein n=1 Tax=Aphanomyces astaci TaxID=112090 RepID=A0A9X8E675_APHAT|nr:hypothetical protein DYB28_001096 [Aphanomyces astaci]
MGQGGHSGYVSFNYGDYRDDQRGRSLFRQSASRYRSRSDDRNRDYREECGYYREARGYYRANSGANHDERHYRSCSHSMYADRRHRPTKAMPNRHPPPSVAKATARRVVLPFEEIQALQMDNAKEYVKLGARIQSEYGTRLTYTLPPTCLLLLTALATPPKEEA